MSNKIIYSSFVLILLLIGLSTAKPFILNAKEIKTNDTFISMSSNSFEENTLTFRNEKIWQNELILNNAEINEIQEINKTEENINNNVKIKQEIIGNRIKETINISSNEGITDDILFSYYVQTEGELRIIGKEIYNVKDNKLLGIFRQPYVIDSNNVFLYLNYTLEDNYISFNVPYEYLTQFTYPIIIDPTYDDFSESDTSTISNSDLGYTILGGNFSDKWTQKLQCFLAGQYSGYGSCTNNLISNSNLLTLDAGIIHELNVCGNSRILINSSFANFSDFVETIIRVKSLNVVIGGENSVYTATLRANITLGNKAIYEFYRNWNNSDNTQGNLDSNFNLTIIKYANDTFIVTSDKGLNGEIHNVTNPDNGILSFNIYTGANCDYDDGYDIRGKFEINKIEYFTELESNLDHTIKCYQSQPDAQTSFDSNYDNYGNYCGLQYNGGLNAFNNTGQIFYTYYLPLHDNLTDMVINYKFGDSECSDFECINGHGKIKNVSLALLYPNCFEYAKNSGYLTLQVKPRIIMLLPRTNTENYGNYNYAEHTLECLKDNNSYTLIDADKRNFTYIASIFGAYNFLYNYPYEAMDNDFYNTYNYFYLLYDQNNNGQYVTYSRWMNALIHDWQYEFDNITYETAKTSLFYDLSMSWYFANGSTFNTTYQNLTNGTCMGNGTFCKLGYLINGEVMCEPKQIVLNCAICTDANIGVNTTLDQCQITSPCNNTLTRCDFLNQLTCNPEDSNIVQRCYLGVDSCLMNVYETTCNESYTCDDGKCVFIGIPPVPEPTPPPVSTLPNSVKFSILIVLCVLAFAMFEVFGFVAHMPKAGLIAGLVAVILVLIFASLPNFPFIGGIIPVWLIFITAIIMVLIVVFVLINKMTGDKE